MAKSRKNKEFISTVGRRKGSVARVRLYPGKGAHVVNGKPVEEYFPGEVAKVLFAKPLQVAGAEGKYWVSAKVEGGGKNGQLDAVVHGIARALSLADPEKFRTPLKKQKLLTRDPRIRERRKVGTGGKARRKKQSPKR
ncbi:30S ribosomal protein S9 [Candidatus Microgenomates bacterium]|nr:30S ribosomal protein S9 [Candidatus Microgenomates bacterium]